MVIKQDFQRSGTRKGEVDLQENERFRFFALVYKQSLAEPSYPQHCKTKFYYS
jgi:hypothetical protein